MKTKKKIPHRPRSVAWELIPFTALCLRAGVPSRQLHPRRLSHPSAVLSPIILAYSPGRPDGRLKLTASAFNGLGQYTSSPGHRDYCCAELAISSLAMALTTTSTHFTIPRRVEGWVDLEALSTLHNYYMWQKKRKHLVKISTTMSNKCSCYQFLFKGFQRKSQLGQINKEVNFCCHVCTSVSVCTAGQVRSDHSRCLCCHSTPSVN